LSIALFPGQGVQSAGMDGGLAQAIPEVFDSATRVLGVDVAELCRTGHSGRAGLESTRWAQPAVLTCSVAAYQALAGRGERFMALAGHSVGEYAALVACGALELEPAVRLVAVRAAATADVAASVPGGMAALMKADAPTVARICEEAGVALAGDNATGQMVVSGPLDALEKAIALGGEAGAVCRRLDVEGAFHSPIMAPASDRLAEALDGVTINPPSIEFWSSTTATQLTDPADIRTALLDQLVKGVRWRETVSALAERHGSTVTDLGPGKVVGTLARRIVPNPEVRFAADLLPVGGEA
jgi:[acyl-carrier-protein] S-malonyltransferase